MVRQEAQCESWEPTKWKSRRRSKRSGQIRNSTARAAHELSYNVTFASDAMTDMDAAMHELMIKKIFPRLGEVDTTDALLALMRR